jgi:hypothetical protein
MRQRDFSKRVTLVASIIATLVIANLSVAKDDAAAPPGSGHRIREGTQLTEVSGKFEAIGDRANFVFADSGESVHVLENLALQRVARVLPQVQPGTQWTISGVVTEFNGNNYLLLTKAVQIGKPAQKASAAASGIGTRAPVDYSKANHEKPGAKKQESKDVSHP